MQKACAWPRCTELAFLFDGSELSASHSRGEGRSFIVGGLGSGVSGAPKPLPCMGIWASHRKFLEFVIRACRHTEVKLSEHGTRW